MNVIKPLQAVCSNAPCRRRQVVPGDRVWYVDVRNGPGSHREAGWACRICGTENTTPPSHLPRGTIALLPSRQEVVDRIAAKPVRDRRDAASDRTETISAVERKPMAARTPPRSHAGVLPPSSLEGTSAADAVVIAAPAAAKRARGRDAMMGPDTERRGVSEVDPDDRPAPTWLIGRPAKAALIEAFTRMAGHGGDAVAVSTGRKGFDVVEVRTPSGDDMNESELAAFADAVLVDLEARRADVLILGGSVDGRAWQAIMHVSAGATSFV